MPNGDHDLVDLPTRLFVFACNDNNLQRQLNLQQPTVDRFDRANAEPAGKLEDDRPIACKSLPLQARRPALLPTKDRMNRNAADGCSAWRYSPVPQVRGTL